MNADPDDAERFLNQSLSDLGKLGSTLIYLGHEATRLTPESITKGLAEAMRQQTDDDSPAPNSIKISQADAKVWRAAVPRWLLESLLIRLDCLAHAVPDRLWVRGVDCELTPLEKDYARVRRWTDGLEGVPGTAIKVRAAYKQLIRMSVYRNALVHAGGEVNSSQRARLLNALWLPEEVEGTLTAADLTYDDILVFRSAIRTMGSRLVQMVRELGPEVVWKQ